jgi:hypothetical protein
MLLLLTHSVVTTPDVTIAPVMDQIRLDSNYILRKDSYVLAILR